VTRVYFLIAVRSVALGILAGKREEVTKEECQQEAIGRLCSITALHENARLCAEEARGCLGRV